MVGRESKLSAKITMIDTWRRDAELLPNEHSLNNKLISQQSSNREVYEERVTWFIFDNERKVNIHIKQVVEKSLWALYRVFLMTARGLL
jgi:hypothetical protein